MFYLFLLVECRDNNLCTSILFLLELHRAGHILGYSIGMWVLNKKMETVNKLGPDFILLILETKTHCIFKQWLWSQTARGQIFTHSFCNWLGCPLLYPSTFSSAINDPQISVAHKHNSWFTGGLWIWPCSA